MFERKTVSQKVTQDEEKWKGRVMNKLELGDQNGLLNGKNQTRDKVGYREIGKVKHAKYEKKLAYMLINEKDKINQTVNCSRRKLDKDNITPY